MIDCSQAEARELFLFSADLYGARRRLEALTVFANSEISPRLPARNWRSRIGRKKNARWIFFFRCENICFRELHEEPLRSLPPISFQDFFSESRKKIASRLTVKIAIGLLENCKFGWLHTHRFARSLSGRTQDVSVRFKTCCTQHRRERFRLMADERRRESIDLARHLSANNASSLDRKKKKQQSNRLLRRHFSFTAREMC